MTTIDRFRPESSGFPGKMQLWNAGHQVDYSSIHWLETLLEGVQNSRALTPVAGIGDLEDCTRALAFTTEPWAKDNCWLKWINWDLGFLGSSDCGLFSLKKFHILIVETMLSSESAWRLLICIQDRWAVHVPQVLLAEHWLWNLPPFPFWLICGIHVVFYRLSDSRGLPIFFQVSEISL